MRHIHLLGIEKPILYRLLPALEEEMGAAYPELKTASAMITETLRFEEERFAEMLSRGLGLLDKELENLKTGENFSGEVAFKLYDTYGFPLDLTQDALRRKGHQVDVAAFDKALEAQQDSSRSAWKGSGDSATDDLFLALADKIAPTQFTGYSQAQSEGKVLALIQNGKRVEKLEKNSPAMVLLDRTPFYAESGGQIGDRGSLSQGSENLFLVEDTQKEAGTLHMHYGNLERGALRVGDSVLGTIDDVRRTHIRANHSATHLMNEALLQVLGAHVAQKGSLVDEHHLRFDFSHNKPLELEEINKVEDLVNRQIRMNARVQTEEMPQDKAKASGAIAMFGEKYDDIVRVLFMGEPPAQQDKRKAFSIEFCGGTHVHSTGDIALFKIVSQSSVGSGVRRVVALTGAAAFHHLRAQEARLTQAAHALKTPPELLPERLNALIEENKTLHQSLKAAKRNLALSPQKQEKSHVETIGDIKFMHRIVENMDAKETRALVDDAKKQIGSGVVAFVSHNQDKGNATLMVGITKDLTPRLDAVVLVKMGAAILGGSGGGGRADMAQAGGPEGAKAKEAIQAVREGLS
jgi:alanyl-tRNA synthetase